MLYTKQWDFLKNKFESQQLGHAYLLSGRDMESVQNFAKDFVKFINCMSVRSQQAKDDRGSEKFCDECYNCRMIEKESFPDLVILKSENSESSLKNEKDMMSIDIEQIRELQNFLVHTSFYGKYKAVIIENAERMTIEAQNCLLKNLEEPKGKTIIFLISSKSEILLPTIISRCGELRFINSEINLEVSERDKEILEGLLKIIDLDIAEKFQYVKQVNLEGDNFGRILSMLQRYFRSLLLSKIGIKEKNEVLDKKNYNISQLQSIIKLIDNIMYQSNTANLNSKLALEILLMEI